MENSLPGIASDTIMQRLPRCQHGVAAVGQPSTTGFTSIQHPIPIIARFSVSDTKPSGTLLSPPTQAHLISLGYIRFV